MTKSQKAASPDVVDPKLMISRRLWKKQAWFVLLIAWGFTLLFVRVPALILWDNTFESVFPTWTMVLPAIMIIAGIITYFYFGSKHETIFEEKWLRENGYSSGMRDNLPHLGQALWHLMLLVLVSGAFVVLHRLYEIGYF